MQVLSKLTRAPRPQWGDPDPSSPPAPRWRTRKPTGSGPRLATWSRTSGRRRLRCRTSRGWPGPWWTRCCWPTDWPWQRHRWHLQQERTHRQKLPHPLLPLPGRLLDLASLSTITINQLPVTTRWHTAPYSSPRLSVMARSSPPMTSGPATPCITSPWARLWRATPTKLPGVERGASQERLSPWGLRGGKPRRRGSSQRWRPTRRWWRGTPARRARTRRRTRNSRVRRGRCKSEERPKLTKKKIATFYVTVILMILFSHFIMIYWTIFVRITLSSNKHSIKSIIQEAK